MIDVDGLKFKIHNLGGQDIADYILKYKCPSNICLCLGKNKVGHATMNISLLKTSGYSSIDKNFICSRYTLVKNIVEKYRKMETLMHMQGETDVCFNSVIAKISDYSRTINIENIPLEYKYWCETGLLKLLGVSVVINDVDAHLAEKQSRKIISIKSSRIYKVFKLPKE